MTGHLLVSREAVDHFGRTSLTLSRNFFMLFGLPVVLKQGALAYVREGDTLVVWRLDRLGRSLKHLIETVTELNTRNIGFKSITENIDTTTSGGKLIFHIFGALAEFERDIIRERTRAGLTAARARGRVGGRARILTPQQIGLLQNLYNDKTTSIEAICKTLRISRATLYRYIKGK